MYVKRSPVSARQAWPKFLVDAHDIELPLQRLPDHMIERTANNVVTGCAGATRVNQERAKLGSGCTLPNKCQLNGPLCRALPVQRSGHRRALKTVTARRPRHPLRIEGG